MCQSETLGIQLHIKPVACGEPMLFDMEQNETCLMHIRLLYVPLRVKVPENQNLENFKK